MTRRRLRIGLVAPLVTTIAPPFVGGTQVMLYELAYGLAARGHAVTVYASKGSKLAAPNLRLIEIETSNANLNLADFNFNSQGAASSNAFFDQANLFLNIFLDISQHRADFDIVHAHAFDWPAYAFGTLAAVPTVHTLHLPAVDERINKLLETATRKNGSSHCVTVSQACAQTFAPYFAFDRIIYNGIKIEDIAFRATAQDFVVFVGRMSPEKGADLAIEIARRAGKRLVLAGDIYDQPFFESQIAPRLAADSNLEYRGLLDRSALFDLMGKAQAALFPARWDEPFGLALAEAQATGTPVVAFRRGAAPEIVVDGETGFLVEPDDLDAGVLALNQTPKLDRARCRARIAQHFNYDQMLDAYEDYYYSKLTVQA